MGHVCWLSNIFIPKKLNRVARILAKEINGDKRKLKINSIAVSGTSGLGMGAVVSYLTHLPLIVVRKTTSDCHSSIMAEFDDNSIHDVNPSIDNINFCIVDDLVSSGKTVKHIHSEIRREHSCAQLVKIYLYCDESHAEESSIDIKDFSTFPVSAHYFE